MKGKKFNPKALAGDLPAKEFVNWLKTSADVLGESKIGSLIRSYAYRVHPDGLYPSQRLYSKDVTVEYKSQAVLDAEAKGIDLVFGTDTTWEHCVPCAVLSEILLKNYDKISQSEETAKAFFDKYYHVCLVTKDEDKKLKENGFNNKMPAGWDFGSDEWERYNKVGIVAVKQNMRRPVPQYTFLAIQKGKGTKTKIVTLTRNDIVDMKSGWICPNVEDAVIDSTTENLEKGWIYILKGAEEIQL